MEPNSKRNKPGLADLKIDPELRTYKKKNKPTVWIISGFFVLTAVSVLGMTLRSAPTEYIKGPATFFTYKQVVSNYFLQR